MSNKYKIFGSILVLIMILFLVKGFNDKISEYESKISKYENKISECESSISEYKSKIEDLNKKISDASPWFEMSKEEQQEIAYKQENEKKEALKFKEEQEDKEQETKENKKQVKSENTEKDNYVFDYHYEGEPTTVGKGIIMSKCPYCGGRYIDDLNDYSSYCMDCGVGMSD